MRKYFITFISFLIFASTGLSNPNVIQAEPDASIAADVRTINGVAVPNDFPIINTTVRGETAPGRLFFASTFFDSDSRSNYIVICENDGTPYFYRRYSRANLGTGEFEVQPNGKLSFYKYINSNEGFYVLMNEHFTEIDTFRAARGFRTDSHELLLLDNGHALMVCEEDRKMDMSKRVSGGKKNATVVGNHIQEVDSDGNLYWEWECWDYLNPEDATEVDIKSGHIDYVHLNSIAIDYDGHYVLSFRSLAEVAKINSKTGEFIWRFGGKHNEFEIINEDRGISAQHHIMPVPGKPDHYTIYDNGNSHSPRYTRAVEFKLDPEKKTAERVWQYRYDKVNFASMMGSVQRLPNGNTYIDWSAWPPLRACEVDADNNLVFEMEVQGVSSYRSRRYDWEGMMLKPYVLIENRYDGIVLIFNKFGDENVDHYVVYGGKNPNDLVAMDTTSNTYTKLADLDNENRYYFKVRAVGKDGQKSDFSETVDVYVKLLEPGKNLLDNGDFSGGHDNWELLEHEGAKANGYINDGEYFLDIDNGGSAYWHVQLAQEEFPLIQGRKYAFEFDARAESNRVIEPRVAENGDDYTNYGKTDLIEISRRKEHYNFEFQMTDPTDYQARVVMNCGNSNVDCYFDNISVKEISPFHSVPGRFEAEDYTMMSGIQTEPTDDNGGGLNVGWIDDGDWMDYMIQVSKKGTYKLDLRVAASSNQGEIQIQKSGKVLSTVELPVTGGWQTWTTVSTNVVLEKGKYLIRLYAQKGGFNVNWLDFTFLTSVKELENTPGAEFMLENYPNPFNNTTRITFSLPESGHTKVDVYDIRGRLVQTLADKALPAGKHTLLWNGLDNNGKTQASGVYWVKVKTSTQSCHRKITLLH